MYAKNFSFTYSWNKFNMKIGMNSEASNWSLVQAYKNGLIFWKSTSAFVLHIIKDVKEYQTIVQTLKRKLQPFYYIAIDKENSSKTSTKSKLLSYVL